MKRDQLIYTVIWQLTEFGLGIKTSDDRYAGNFLASRDFELPTLKLLVDAVQSSRFITVKKSEDLIKKLEAQTSRENAKYLQRQVYIYNRTKAKNDAIYQNLDTLHTAVHGNR